MSNKKKLNTIFVNTQLDAGDVLDGLSTGEYEDAIKFVMDLDSRFEDVDFTEALITKLLDSLKLELGKEFNVKDYLK